MAKRLFVIILIVILTSSCAWHVCAAHIEIDGYVNEKTWHSAQTQVLLSGSNVSNCDVEFATAQVLFDEENHLVYLGFKIRLATVVADLDEKCYGIRLSVNYGEFVEFTTINSDIYDIDAYSYDVAFSSDAGERFNAEVLLGVKYGLETVESIRVRFIDGFGIPSNVYDVDLPAVLSEETTAYVEENTTSLTEDNTTKSITTTAKTTTTKATTQRTTKPTTQMRTSSVRNTKTEADKTETTKQPKTEATTVQTVTVYITVTVPEYISVQSVAESSSAPATEPTQKADDVISNPGKVAAYLVVALMLVITFGVIIVVNMNAEKKAQDMDKKK